MIKEYYLNLSLVAMRPRSLNRNGCSHLLCDMIGLLGSLSTRDFETRTASGSELFPLRTRLHTITFTLLSTFPSLGMISIKMWETTLSWHAKCPFPVAVRVSKRRVLTLPNLFFVFVFFFFNFIYLLLFFVLSVAFGCYLAWW